MRPQTAPWAPPVVEQLLAATSARFELGRPVAWRELDGGFTNRVVRLDTDRGAWAIKVLDRRHPSNVDPTRRRTALDVERAALAAGIAAPPIVSDRHGEVIVAVGAAQVRVHRWAHGRAPGSEAPPVELAAEVGGFLAGLHRAELPVIRGAARPSGPGRVVDAAAWRAHLEIGRRRRAPWVEPLADAVGAIERASRLAAAGGPAAGAIGTHRDLYPHNALVGPGGVVACDWDLAGPWSPPEELAAAAVEWSGGILETVEPGAFGAVVEAYVDAGGSPLAPGAGAWAGFFAKQLAWLDGQLHRAVGRHPQPGAGSTADAATAAHRIGFLIPRLCRQIAEVDEWVELLAAALRGRRPDERRPVDVSGARPVSTPVV